MAQAPGRFRRILRAVRRHPLRTLALLLGLGFVALNLLAWSHAGALTSYVPGAPKPRRAEQLSLLERAWTLLRGVRVRRPTNDRTPAADSLPFEVVALDADGTALEAWWVPAGADAAVVVVCHGYAASKASQLPVARELRRLGLACLLLDFRGSGGSSGSHTSLGFDEAADVAAALDHARLLAPERPVLLFGTSMGAAAALRAVHLGSAPDALLLESPYNRLLDTVRNRFALMGVPSFPAAELMLFWGGVRGGFDAFAHNPAEYAAAVRCPTLLLHGAVDQRVSEAEVREVYAALPGASRRLVLFEGVGHRSLLGARPELWREAVGGFLDSLGMR